MKPSLKPLGLLVVLALGGASVSAVAASDERLLASPARVVAPPAAQAAKERSVEFPGIAWGDFLLFPELVVSAMRDDNI